METFSGPDTPIIKTNSSKEEREALRKVFYLHEGGQPVLPYMPPSYLLVNATKVSDGIFLGNQDAGNDFEFIMSNKITHIINCAGHIVPNVMSKFGVKYLTFRWTDTKSTIMFDQKGRTLQQICKFVDEAVAESAGILVQSVHGRSRSCCVVCAYLMKKYGWSARKALEYIQFKRPDVSPKPYYWRQLKRMEKRLHLSETTGGIEGRWLSDCFTVDEQVARNTFLNGHYIKAEQDVDGDFDVYDDLDAPENENTVAEESSRNKKRLQWIDESEGTINPMLTPIRPQGSHYNNKPSAQVNAKKLISILKTKGETILNEDNEDEPDSDDDSDEESVINESFEKSSGSTTGTGNKSSTFIDNDLSIQYIDSVVNSCRSSSSDEGSRTTAFSSQPLPSKAMKLDDSSDLNFFRSSTSSSHSFERRKSASSSLEQIAPGTNVPRSQTPQPNSPYEVRNAWSGPKVTSKTSHEGSSALNGFSIGPAASMSRYGKSLAMTSTFQNSRDEMESSTTDLESHSYDQGKNGSSAWFRRTDSRSMRSKKSTSRPSSSSSRPASPKLMTKRANSSAHSVAMRLASTGTVSSNSKVINKRRTSSLLSHSNASALTNSFVSGTGSISSRLARVSLASKSKLLNTVRPGFGISGSTASKITRKRRPGSRNLS